MKNNNPNRLIGFCSNCDKVFDPPPNKDKVCCKGHFILLIEKSEYDEIMADVASGKSMFSGWWENEKNNKKDIVYQ